MDHPFSDSESDDEDLDNNQADMPLKENKNSLKEDDTFFGENENSPESRKKKVLHTA